jgi:hypothetical protein
MGTSSGGSHASLSLSLSLSVLNHNLHGGNYLISKAEHVWNQKSSIFCNSKKEIIGWCWVRISKEKDYSGDDAGSPSARPARRKWREHLRICSDIYPFWLKEKKRLKNQYLSINFKEKMILRLLWLVGIMVIVRCSSIYSSIVLLWILSSSKIS